MVIIICTECGNIRYEDYAEEKHVDIYGRTTFNRRPCPICNNKENFIRRDLEESETSEFFI